MRFLEYRLSRRSLAVLTAGTVAIAPFARVLGQSVIPYEAPENIDELEGEFDADGSSTLGPLTEAAIEEFAAIAPNVRITNGISGTGGGFERFGRGETVISNASRPIKESEVQATRELNMPWFEFEMAYDGLSIVVNPDNDWCSDLTVEELHRMWAADGGVTTWADIRPDWPAENIELYGAGTMSGTFDYFVEAILGDDVEIRSDYTPSEDDNVLVQGVSGSVNALGFFGYSYFEENQDVLKAVAVDNGDGPVLPSMETVMDGSYAPLSRSLFIYVAAEPLQTRPEVAEFVKFFAAIAADIAPSVGFIPVNEETQQATFDKVLGAIDGTLTPDSETFGAEDEATPAASPAA